jgi:polysaccharide biosynthesis/export protein
MSSAILLALLLLPAASPPAGQGNASANLPAPPASADTRPVGAADRDYRIGAGDILRIAVYGYDDLSQTVIVQPSGSFVFPLVGAVSAAELTPAELEQILAGRLAKGFIRDAKVTVAVQEYRSKVVFVVGEVARPGTYPLAGQTGVVEIVARAGPLSANAGTEIVVVRAAAPLDGSRLPSEKTRAAAPAAPAVSAAGSGSQGEVLRVDMREIQAGRLDKNILLQPNDTVIVPQATRVFVSGEVRNPGAFPFSQGLSIRQAVSLAGGFSPDASTGKARVVRQINGRSKTLKLKMDEPAQSGDTIIIQTRLF